MGFLVNGGGKHGEVAAGGALVAEEGVAGVERVAPLGLDLAFAAFDFGGEWGFEIEVGGRRNWGFKRKR